MSYVVATKTTEATSDTVTWSSSSTTPTLSNPTNNATNNMYNSPAAVVFNNLIYVFFQDPEATGALWYVVFDGTAWSPIMQAGGTVQMTAPAGNLVPESPQSLFLNLGVDPFTVSV